MFGFFKKNSLSCLPYVLKKPKQVKKSDVSLSMASSQSRKEQQQYTDFFVRSVLCLKS